MMPVVLVFDQIARVAAIALLALLSLVLLRDRRSIPSAPVAVAFFITMAAYLVLSSPQYPGPAPAFDLVLRVAALAAPAAFWLFVRALFDDDPSFTVRDAALVVVLVGIGLTRTLPGNERFGTLLYYVTSAGFVSAALAHVVRGLPADLVEPRRRLRTAFTVLVGAEMLIVLGAEVILAGGKSPLLLESIKSAGALWLTSLFAVWLLRPRAELLTPVPAAPDRTVTNAAQNAAAEDARFRERLLTLMRDEQVYKQEGLTIGLLARKLDVPEYRLRRIINQQLGYKNFNAFLNAMRIDEACRILQDASQERLPILNLALDLGYGSLGPFNRAFRAKTGQTPTDYRRANLRSPSSAA